MGWKTILAQAVMALCAFVIKLGLEWKRNGGSADVGTASLGSTHLADVSPLPTLEG